MVADRFARGSLGSVEGHVADFSVTPKGHSRSDLLPKRVVAPYVLLALVPRDRLGRLGPRCGGRLLRLQHRQCGRLWRPRRCSSAIAMPIENRLKLLRLSACRPLLAVPLLISWIAIAGASPRKRAETLAAMNIGISAFTLTETVYPAAGAGFGRPGKPVIRLRPRWRGFHSARPEHHATKATGNEDIEEHSDRRNRLCRPGRRSLLRRLGASRHLRRPRCRAHFTPEQGRHADIRAGTATGHRPRVGCRAPLFSTNVPRPSPAATPRSSPSARRRAGATAKRISPTSSPAPERLRRAYRSGRSHRDQVDRPGRHRGRDRASGEEGAAGCRT